MRAILHIDYQRLRPAVAVQKILFMAQHPGRPFCVWFDYSQRGDPETRVISADELPALPEFEAELPMLWDRLARAGGHMEIHIICVNQRGVARALLFPMRSSSSKFNDGLRRIASEIPAAESMTRAEDVPPQMYEKIRVLFDETDLDDTRFDIH